MSNLKLTAAQMRKAIVALVAFVGQLVAAGVLDGDAKVYVMAVIAALSAIGVYAVPNDDA